MATGHRSCRLHRAHLRDALARHWRRATARGHARSMRQRGARGTARVSMRPFVNQRNDRARTDSRVNVQQWKAKKIKSISVYIAIANNWAPR
eukprot:9022657-Pyramimonas_sp.AAC.1